VNIRAIRGVRGRLLPLQLASVALADWCRTKLQVLLVSKGFFENFAPPFPEKELRDGTQKKSKNKY
jgi:hypothetical protein